MKTSRSRFRSRTFFTGDPSPMAKGGAVIVIGLGRFGTALARELTDLGIGVVGVDIREDVVDELRTVLPFVTCADATQDTVLRELGVEHADRVVVAIGSDLEASILSASRVLKLGNGRVWAKAISEAQAEILEQLGVHTIVRPEEDMGRRIAHLMRGHMSDFLRIDQNYAMVRTRPPQRFVGTPLGQLNLRKEYQVTVFAVKRNDIWTNTDRDTVLEAKDEIIVAGEPSIVERFVML